jgi:O-antigen/teichoic acid export membrane protein
MKRLRLTIERKLLALPAHQRGRLLRGTAVNALSQIVTAVLSIATIPLLISMWGTERYGLWVLISALPAYLAMSDLGFGWAATNKMTLAVGAQDYPAAQRTHQTLMGLNLVVVGSLAVIATLTISFLSPTLLPDVEHLSAGRIRGAIMLLCWNALLSVGWSTMSSALRANGAYPTSVMLNDSVRVIEGVTVLVVAASGGDILLAALASFIARASCYSIISYIVGRIVPWFSFRLDRFSFEELRELMAPAFAAFMLPLGFALNIQGMTIIVGAVLGLQSLALFTAARTITRLSVQAMGIIGNAIVPEISRSIGAKDGAALKSIFSIAIVITLSMAISFVALMGIFGAPILHIYTHGKFDVSASFIFVMAVAAVLQGLWNTGGNVLLGANRQSSYAYHLMALSGLGLACAWLLAPLGGLIGTALIMCAIEAAMLFCVARGIGKLFEEFR